MDWAQTFFQGKGNKIVEIILQTAIYCGFPAALDSMRTVADTIADYRKEVAGTAD